MGDSNDSLFQQEQARLRKYEIFVPGMMTESDTEVAYKELNSRYTKLQDSTGKISLHSMSKEMFQERKVEIEQEWVANAGIKTLDFKDRAQGKNKKSVEYYSTFTMKEMELLLKSNDRGGNSTEYNDVVTDLELYNTVESSVTDTAEKVDLLKRIESSCNTYISKRHPITSSGKVRKAMIRRVAQQIREELAKYDTTSTQATAQSQVGVQATASTQVGLTFDAVTATFTALQTDKSQQALYTAAQAHFDLISRVVQGQVTLKETQISALDTQMTYICQELKNQPIDDDQNDVFSTRFFNALGWTSRQPEVVEDYEIDDVAMESPLKKKLFHCIDSSGDPDKGATLGRQLLSDQGQRHYLSNGQSGKGTYLGMRGDIPGSSDERVRDHLWSSYGREVGAVQFSMCFNKNAKIIERQRLVNMVNKQFRGNFSQLYGLLSSSESGPMFQYLTTIAAFFGYNTIQTQGTLEWNPSIWYFVTTDRSALTISNTVLVREQMGDGFSTHEQKLV